MPTGPGSKLILAFVTLIIGAVLIATVATQGNAVTDKIIISDETEAFTPVDSGNINTTEVHTVTNAPTSWKVNDCPISAVSIKNASGGTALTLTTDYTLTASAGTFLLENTSTTVAMIGADNNTYVDYTYCGDDYMNLTWGRTAVDLVSGFFAIALLLISVGLFYSVAKDSGVI